MSLSLSVAGAIQSTLAMAMEQDERVLLLGEAVGRMGGVHQTSQGLLERFGPERVIDTPLSEAGLVGLAVGLALGGKRPVVELVGPVTGALEQLAGEAATVTRRSGGEFTVPLVVRVPIGPLPGGPSQIAPEGWLAAVEGLTVLVASDASDSAGLLQTALAQPGPTVLLEPRSMYVRRGRVSGEPTPITAAVLLPGDDVTVLAYGEGVSQALEAAQASSVSVEVIDLRSLRPLDEATLLTSVRKTGRAIVATRSPALAERLNQLLTREAFLYLESPPARCEPVAAALGGAITASVTF